jgi:HSP20 family protein
MAEPVTKLPIRREEREAEPAPALGDWRPLESLRREMESLFDDFGRGFWRSPLRRSIFDLEPRWPREMTWVTTPAVDIVEKDTAYEVTAELPGMDESNIDVKVSNNTLTIRGEKKEEKEEKKKDYYLSERRFGSFERRFQIPQGVDAAKIDARFKKGVLTVALPKTPEAQAQEKKIAVKAG